MAGITTSTLWLPGVANIPEFVFSMFQMTFAIITPALIAGAFAERMKFSALLIFTALWSIFVYSPIAHWVWGGGFLGGAGVLDFAGGTVVHINAGVAGLVGCLMIGKRTGFGKEQMPPHSLTLSWVGAGMLWVGWFGFNAGSALSAGASAGLAMMTTFVATAGAILGWSLVEWFTHGKPSMLGAVSGAVAGLVAVTPAAGFVGPAGAIALGFIAGIVCFFFVTTVKNAFGYDDSLDVFGVHGIGDILGALGTGVLASPSLGGVGYADGVTMGAQLWVQVEAVAFTIVMTGVGSAILFKLVDLVVGLRVDRQTEAEGLDIVEHGERAYHS